MTSSTELERRLNQQAIIADLGQQALETDDLDGLMHDVTVAVAETLDTEYCKVLELLPGGDEVFLRQGVGWREGLVGSATVPTDTDSQAGYTLISAEPVIVDDLRTETRFSGPALRTDHDVISGISVIIGPIEAPWGVLGIHDTERRDFTESEAMFVQNVANVLASAIKREEHERTIEEANRRMELALSTTDATVWEWELDTDIVTTHPEPHGLFDTAVQTSDEFLGPIHPDDRERVEQALNEAIETKKPYRAEYRYLVDGAVRWAEDYGELFEPIGESGNRMIGVAYDITERRRRETELRERNKELAALHRTAELFRTNDAPPARLLGKLAEEIPSWFQVPAQTDVRIRYDDTEVDNDGFDQTAETIEAVSHTSRDVEVRLTASRRADDIEGRPFLQEEQELFDTLTSFLSEVLERHAREQELKARERALQDSHERLEEFASAVSHDLREPLNTVASYLQLLERRYVADLEDDAQEFIEFAVSDTARMRDMIDNLVTTYAQVESAGATFKPVDLEALLVDVRRDLNTKITANDADIHVDQLPSVVGDRGQLRQVFTNLLDNAMKYSGDAPPTIYVSADVTDEMCEVSVSDEGIGIAPEAIGRVFDVFERAHSDDTNTGTGIGLALCDRIVDRHGGDIWVESNPGEGATFTFTLPVANEGK